MKNLAKKAVVFLTVRTANAKTLHLWDPESERECVCGGALQCASPLLTPVLTLSKGPGGALPWGVQGSERRQLG